MRDLRQKQDVLDPAKKTPAKTDGQCFHAHTFIIDLHDDWRDSTIYTLTGPVTNGIQHNVIITMENDLSFDTVVDYAEWQIMALETELKSCRLLKMGKITLTNNVPAYQAVFRWYPTDELRLYQHQIFVLVDRILLTLQTSLYEVPLPCTQANTKESPSSSNIFCIRLISC